METKKVWFVTGASKGLGFELVKKLLSEGFRVAATSRTVESLISAFGKPQKISFRSASTLKITVI
jgi:NAD(P)-dependent dehydrogenase (short-subunit alcohol dehydrogenase family)